MGLGSLIVIAEGFPIRDGLIGFGLFSFLSLALFGYIYNKWEEFNQKPAIQPSEESASQQKSSYKQGYARGEEFREAWAERIFDLPGVIWTVGTLIGIFLSLAMWVLVGVGYEFAGVLALTGGMAFLGISVMADTLRLSQKTDLNFRWWFYFLLVIIPMVNFIFGFVWLARKRQKTGSALN